MFVGYSLSSVQVEMSHDKATKMLHKMLVSKLKSIMALLSRDCVRVPPPVSVRLFLKIEPVAYEVFADHEVGGV